MPKKKQDRDEKDVQIDKLKHVNAKLRGRIKELNLVVEKAIEKANSKRIISQKHKYETDMDVDHLLQVREKEIQNA
eukprot:CAMPEP_0202968238 /NCGR_PEP_ID=MMETSP1396-20130829/13474_1 /ASSEMBLY_ACC=CAM_ASM_000872 /TAXON_ID= /ORGANISM="Pseudokeronopsis sp., Strain Brazil" /LENGTH=75 /DNA_ID=CAMNT_0049694335 /DNA_START=44 /DNA_END=271 /DNA_ORIENTATION=+